MFRERRRRTIVSRGLVGAEDEVALEARMAAARQAMVDQQLARRDITDEWVLAAMRVVPRHLFVTADLQHEAHNDHPLAVTAGQTISQPYIVGLMSQALGGLPPGSRVLEIGAGTGYQTAVLVEMGYEVHAVEVLRPMYTKAIANLALAGREPEGLHHGDGVLGWPAAAPYQAILCAASAAEVPAAWAEQLVEGGCIVTPVGPAHGSQWLVRLTKINGALQEERLCAVRFVPLVGA